MYVNFKLRITLTCCYFNTRLTGTRFGFKHIAAGFLNLASRTSLRMLRGSIIRSCINCKIIVSRCRTSSPISTCICKRNNIALCRHLVCRLPTTTSYLKCFSIFLARTFAFSRNLVMSHICTVKNSCTNSPLITLSSNGTAINTSCIGAHSFYTRHFNRCRSFIDEGHLNYFFRIKTTCPISKFRRHIKCALLTGHSYRATRKHFIIPIRMHTV